MNEIEKNDPEVNENTEQNNLNPTEETTQVPENQDSVTEPPTPVDETPSTPTEPSETGQTESVPTTETLEEPVEETNSQPAETVETPEASASLHPAMSSDEEDEGTESEMDQEDSEVEDEYYGIPVRAYDEMNLDALGEELERLLRGHDVKEIRNHVREIKTEFDLKFDAEREQMKKEFLEGGGNIIDFSYSTPSEQKFNKLYFEYKEKRDDYYKTVRKNLQENLERRLAIIEELKSITGVGTDMNVNFKSFRNLQDRWRKAGPVPRNDYKDTWNTYHYHVERFYEFLHLDREFREMDYKYNLKQKLKMIDRAEELTQEKNVNRAFRELQNLHRMWKEEVGPVSQEFSDAIWEKFSEATRLIHENRRAFFAERDQKREDNLTAKQEVIEKIAVLAQNEFKSHKEAQQKIKEANQLREEFFKIGKVPMKDNNAVWEAFKIATRDFNHKKNNFYKERKETFRDNLERKMELIAIAEEHKDSDDFETVTPLMKKIQNEWKNIGYVPRSKSDKIWKRFKKACNHYFDRLHAERNKENQGEIDAYNKKADMLKEVLELQLSGNRDEDLNLIKAKINEWKQIGRVPRNKQHIEGKFNKALDTLFGELDMNKQEAELLKYDNYLQSLDDDDNDDRIRREASFLYKKIEQTKDEIIQLETNLQFFDKVDKNNPLMKGTFRNIEQLKQQLEVWKAKLQKLKQL